MNATTARLTSSIFKPQPGRRLLAKGALTVQGVPVDIEWVPNHYSSANTVLVRLPSSWSEAWGEDVKLSAPFADIGTDQLLADVRKALFSQPDALAPSAM